MAYKAKTFRPNYREAKRYTKKQHRRLYDDVKWRRVSAEFLMYNPLCAFCNMPAQCVDHIVPHRGDFNLFWDYDNYQSLCFRCHNRKSAAERHGRTYTPPCSDCDT